MTNKWFAIQTSSGSYYVLEYKGHIIGKNEWIVHTAQNNDLWVMVLVHQSIALKFTHPQTDFVNLINSILTSTNPNAINEYIGLGKHIMIAQEHVTNARQMIGYAPIYLKGLTTLNDNL